MHILIGIIVAVLVVTAILALVAMHYMNRGLNFIRRMFSGEYTDEEVERYSQKRYRDKSGQRFSDDYFKSSGASDSEEQPQQAPRYTTSADGSVNIIDEHHHERTNRKIFQEDEGEYVEYSEVKD